MLSTDFMTNCAQVHNYGAPKRRIFFSIVR